MRAEEAAETASAVADGIVMEGLSVEDEKVLSENKESFVFQAEVNRLMDIIINSLCKYPHFFQSFFQRTDAYYYNHR